MSQNIVYTTIPQLVNSLPVLKDRIDAVGTILSNMEVLMAIKDDTITYKLDTGQTRIEKTYMNFADLQKSYEQLFKLQQMMIARYNTTNNGRVIRLVDSKNFIGNNGTPFKNWNI